MKILLLIIEDFNSLNNNNGSGKTFILEMLHHIDDADLEKSGIFFSKRVDLNMQPASKSLLTLFLVQLIYHLN